jgi:DNA-binding MarR family transcriptional regulator
MHDRRKMVLRITEQGEDLVRRLLPTLYGPLREMFKDFSEEAKQQLIVQLEHLGSKLDQAMAQHLSERVE